MCVFYSPFDVQSCNRLLAFGRAALPGHLDPEPLRQRAKAALGAAREAAKAAVAHRKAAGVGIGMEGAERPVLAEGVGPAGIGGIAARDAAEISSLYTDALTAWRRNPIAKRIVDITTDYCLGDGLTPTANGQPALLVPGDPLPQEVRVLPEPDALAGFSAPAASPMALL